MKDRKESLRKSRKGWTAKNTEKERNMRTVWATAGGFLLGAVYGPKLLRLVTRNDIPALLSKVLAAGIPEPWPGGKGTLDPEFDGPAPRRPAGAKEVRS